jgi:hypothetical protein
MCWVDIDIFVPFGLLYLLLLLFYIGNILVDKNTLCKCCLLTGILV